METRVDIVYIIMKEFQKREREKECSIQPSGKTWKNNKIIVQE